MINPMRDESIKHHRLHKSKKVTKQTNTLPETNSSHLKMDGWNTSFLLGWPIFKGHVSFRECIRPQKVTWHSKIGGL